MYFLADFVWGIQPNVVVILHHALHQEISRNLRALVIGWLSPQVDLSAIEMSD
jgi:hypothetical protein